MHFLVGNRGKGVEFDVHKLTGVNFLTALLPNDHPHCVHVINDGHSLTGTHPLNAVVPAQLDGQARGLKTVQWRVPWTAVRETAHVLIGGSTCK